MSKEVKKLFRFENTMHSSMPYLIDFDVIKETDCGYWIEFYGSQKKWVSKYSKKRYGYPTKKEALNNYIKRKERSLLLLYRMTLREKNRLQASSEYMDKNFSK